MRAYRGKETEGSVISRVRKVRGEKEGGGNEG